MFVFLQPEHAVEAPVEYDDDDASLSALDDEDDGVVEDDSVDEDDNGNASVFFIVLNAWTFRSLHDFASHVPCFLWTGFDLNLPLDEFGAVDFDFVQNINGK